VSGADGSGRRVIAALAERCDGCGECVRACSATLGGVAAIQVVETGGRHVPILCQGCADAPCVSACMPGCRYRDEATGRVVTEYQRCIGCWMCVMLCPVGAVKRIPGENGHHGVALRCEGCPSHAVAPCVAACKPKALQQMDPLEHSESLRKLTAQCLCHLESPGDEAGDP
jgi:anaerobic carbon-monoxide dehydrogenase iron sulfur subunit